MMGSNVGDGAGEPVCVQGMGRNGVGVAVELGAAVTRMNGSIVWAGARVPHPTSKILARSTAWKIFLIG